MSFQKDFKKDFQKQNWSVMHPSVKEEIENGEQTKFIAGLVYPDLRPKIYDQDFSKIEQFSEIERREKIIRSTPSPRRVSLKVDETRFPQSWKELKRRRYSESDQFLVNKSSLLRTKQNVSKILTGLKHRNLKKRDLKCLRKRRESSSIHSNSKFDQHRDLEDIDNSSVSSHIVYADTKIIKWNPSLSHQSSQEDHSERNIFGDFSHKSLNEFKSHPNSWMLINKGRIDLEGTEINIESPCTLINGLNNSHLIIPTSSSKVIIEAIQTEGGSNKKYLDFSSQITKLQIQPQLLFSIQSLQRRNLLLKKS